MVILGLSDGTDPGAALVVDDRLSAVHAGRRGEVGIPWASAAEVVARAGLELRDVDQVAIAGRYTPPLAARRRPDLRARGQDPFAQTRAVGTRVQGWLRGTGLGAWDADRATEWFESEIRGRGYRPRRVVLVDLHKCLASAAYRCQPQDDVLILVAHPLGDGSLVSAHHGRAGQLDRLEHDRGSTASQLWLERWFSVLGVPDRQAFDALADAGAVDPGPLEILGRSLDVVGGRIVGRARPGLVLRSDPPWGALSHLAPAVAAATVRAHLRGVVARWISGRVGAYGARDVAIAGSWADDPELTALIASDPSIERVWAGPWVGGAGLAVGAALAMAGIAPALPEGRGPTEVPPDRACREAAGPDASPVEIERLAAVLAEGGAVARFAGPRANTPDGGGSRSVLVRADDPEAIEATRRRLGRPASEAPAVLALPGTLEIPHADKLVGPLRYGTVAAAVDGAVRRIGWVDEPELAGVLAELGRATGRSAVATFPLALGRDPAAASPEEAVRVFRRSGIPLLQLGPVTAEAS